MKFYIDGVLRSVIKLDQGAVSEILSSLREKSLGLTMYGANEAAIIASLVLPAGLFIGFATILIKRLRQFM